MEPRGGLQRPAGRGRPARRDRGEAWAAAGPAPVLLRLLRGGEGVALRQTALRLRRSWGGATLRRGVPGMRGVRGDGGAAELRRRASARCCALLRRRTASRARPCPGPGDFGDAGAGGAFTTPEVSSGGTLSALRLLRVLLRRRSSSPAPGAFGDTGSSTSDARRTRSAASGPLFLGLLGVSGSGAPVAARSIGVSDGSGAVDA